VQNRTLDSFGSYYIQKTPMNAGKGRKSAVFRNCAGPDRERDSSKRMLREKSFEFLAGLGRQTCALDGLSNFSEWQNGALT
jgi:hypothetical protein